MIGLFVGKFQPFHKGHLETVKYILGECSQAKLVIGSSQYHGTAQNPFSLQEREEMISRALSEAQLTNCTLGSMEDVHNFPLWADLLAEKFKPFDTVYTRNMLVAGILKEKGIPTRQQPKFGEVCGTEIRRRMKAGEPWAELVPPAVASYVESLAQ